jgi:hypothetical protein
MLHRTPLRIAAYLGVFLLGLVLAVAVFALLAIIDAPEEWAMLYLEPGSYANALLSKTGPVYTAFTEGLDRFFADATVLGLSLRHSALWLSIALAFVVWACLFSAIGILAHRLFTRRATSAA